VFYDIFKGLCDKKDVSPSRACIDMGLSRSLGAKWKNTGANPSYEVLTKMAEYFDVSERAIRWALHYYTENRGMSFNEAS
jgi:transcriptional regulator with XRE-family HTH domain